MLQKKNWIKTFFDRKFFIDSDFFPTNCHTHKIFKIFITDFFRKKNSCNRSRIFTRNGWWYSQVPNRPREKDIDDFRFFVSRPSPWAPTRGSQPMGPNPGVPTHGPQPGVPSPWVPTRDPLALSTWSQRRQFPGTDPGRRLSAEE